MAAIQVTDNSSHPPWDGLRGTERYAVCLQSVRSGNRRALDTLVEDLTPVVWHVARGSGTNRAEAAEVVQTVWMALPSHISTFSEPRALVGWLITTTRREAQRALRRALNESQSSDPHPSGADSVLWRAFTELPGKCQQLLRLAALASRPEYRIIAETMSMPRGSIGPTRGRCLNILRELLAIEIAAMPFPVSIYLSDEVGHEHVQAAVEQLVRNSDADILDRDGPVLGSWFRRMRAAAKSEVARQVAAGAAHAIESRLVLEQDAKVTAAMMQNVGPVLTSLQPTKDAVIRIGALLIVKVDWTVTVHQLTAVQQLLLDHHPHLLTSPYEILRALSPEANGNHGVIPPLKRAIESDKPIPLVSEADRQQEPPSAHAG
jgi:RNA polymerase sigma factor (sigma-70 family)